MTLGGSEEGGRDELVELRLSRASRSATRRWSAAFCSTRARINARRAGVAERQSGSGIIVGRSMTGNRNELIGAGKTLAVNAYVCPLGLLM